jgi:hypothetical protein
MKVFLFICLLIPSSLLSQCLNGTYTIGGNTPDYGTFTAAINALNTNGVCGPVEFDVRPGSYVEQVTINSIAGASDTNTITFHAENGFSSTVNLNYPSSTFGSNTNYVIKLDGADFLIFENMTIQRTGVANYATVISILNGSSNNEFDDLEILGRYSNVAYENASCLVYSTDTKDTANIFTDNYFFNGSIGLYLSGPSSGSDNETSLKILRNDFVGQTEGIFAQRQTSPYIGQNTFELDTMQNSPAIYLYQCDGASFVFNNKIFAGDGIRSMLSYGSGIKAFVINNMVTTKYTGIIVSSDSRVENNSIWSKGGSYCVISGGTGTEISSNILYCSTNGPAIYTTSGNTCNYNCYYTLSPIFGKYNSTDISGGLEDWNSATGYDLNSVFAKPPFYSENDLHIQYDNLINDMGDPNSLYNYDFDVQLRSPIVDIGADEFNLPTIDAGITNVDSICSTQCAGNHTVYASMRNFGSNTLTSATINWSVNGVLQPSYSFNGTLASLQSINMIPVGSYNFSNTIPSLVKVWTSNPNGSSDGGPINDTAYYNYIATTMSGIFTIGGASPDFVTIPDAFTALTNNGICGPVVFKIRNGTYPTAFTPPTNPPGISATNTVTFESELGDSSLVITYGGQINSGFYRIRGLTIMLNPTFSQTNHTVMYVVGNDNEFHNCAIIGPITNSSFSNLINILGSNLVIKNSMLYGCNKGISFGNQSNSRVIGNKLLNQSTYAMYATSSNGLFIDSNYIKTTQPSGSYGIYISLSSSTFSPVITRNDIFGTGMYFSGTAATSTNPFQISNNFVNIDDIAGAAGTNAIAVLTSAVIYNNTFRIGSVTQNSNCITFRSPNYVQMMNNIVINEAGGKAVDGLFPNSDYNVYYSNGTYLLRYNSINYTSLANYINAYPTSNNHSYQTLPVFQSSTDLHIVSAPLLANTGYYISTIPEDIDGDIRGITPDIGADEFMPVSINNVNVISASLPASNICLTPQPVLFSFSNLGTSNLTNVTVQWSINGVIQTPFNWSGNLVMGSFITNQIIGNYTFDRNINYLVKVWTELPNGMLDGNLLNDTVIATLDAMPTVISNSLLLNTVCPGQAFNLTTYAIPYLHYSWYPASLFNDPIVPDPIASFTNDTTLILTVTDSINGCSVTDSFEVFVFPNCCLSGSYTIGGSNPDFTTLANVSNILSVATICGPVIFNFRPGNYDELLVIPDVTGNTPINTLTFQSENGDSSSVNIHHSSFSFEGVIDIYCNNVVINKLTTTLDSGISNYNVLVHQGVRNVRIEKSVMNIEPVNNNSCAIFYQYPNGKVEVIDNVIYNNVINSPVHGITIYGADSINTRVNIDGNTIYNSGDASNSINVNNVYSPIVNGNTVWNAFHGIRITECHDSIVVSNNQIYEANSTGIDLGYCTSTLDTARVFNNIVRLHATNDPLSCLSLAYNESVYIVNNTLSIQSWNLASSALKLQYDDSVIVLNNILEQRYQGSPVLNIMPADLQLFHFDHNLYSYPGSPLCLWGGSTNNIIPDFIQWQDTSGYENMGLEGNPLFISSSDLHLSTPTSLAAGSALPISWLQTDIDGEVRDLFPDIGADEISGGGTWGAINELSSIDENNLLVYPNPTEGKIWVISYENEPILNLQIYSLSGELVKTVVVKNGSEVDLTYFANGLYQINYNGRVARFIITK